MRIRKMPVAAALALWATLAGAQTSQSVEERLRRLEAEQAAQKQAQAELQKQIEERDARIRQLEEQLKAQAPAAPPPAAPSPTAPPPEVAAAPTGQVPQVPGGMEKGFEPENPTYWGEFDPGQGFLVGRNDMGELDISAYALVRYLDQHDSDGVFTDHLGDVRTVDARNDIWSHRVMVFF
jgi:uncharacterized coiled-coil protein SlyX